MYRLSEVLAIISIIILIYILAWFMLAVLLKRRDVIDSAWGLGFVLIPLPVKTREKKRENS